MRASTSGCGRLTLYRECRVLHNPREPALRRRKWRPLARAGESTTSGSYDPAGRGPSWAPERSLWPWRRECNRKCSHCSLSTAPLPPALATNALTVRFSGNDRALIPLCSNGLITTFRRRLAAREPNTTVRWQLQAYLSKPRVMSDRTSILPLPKIPQSALRQVTVRLHTRQALVTTTHRDTGPVEAAAEAGIIAKRRFHLRMPPSVPGPRADAAPAPLPESEPKSQSDTTTKIEDKVEYLVLQRVMLQGVELPWIVSCFLDATTVDSLVKAGKRDAEMHDYQKQNPPYMG